MSNEDEKGKKGFRPPLYPPGIVACLLAIRRLRYFQDLVRHRERFGYEIGKARPLAKLLPKGTPPEQVPFEIERQIHQRTPSVYLTFEAVGAPMDYHTTQQALDRATGEVVPEEVVYNLITEYLDLPARDAPQGYVFGLMMRVLDQAIGLYERYLWRAVRQKFSPIAWIGFALSLPIRVAMDAGLLSPRATPAEAHAGFFRWVQAAWAALLVIVPAATKYAGWWDGPWNWLVAIVTGKP